jgi:hypothetical protein
LTQHPVGSVTALPEQPPNKGMQRILNSSFQLNGVPFGINLIGLSAFGGAIQNR